jgi:hypothetical protein
MSRVSTNLVGLAYCKEDTLGVLPTTPQWRKLEPNSIGAFGSNISTVARNPISSDRQRKKGTIVDLDSGAEYESDLTMDQFLDFSEGFVFANFTAGLGIWGPYQTNTVVDVDGSAESFGVSAGGALTAGTLIYARGFTNSANNGLHEVDSGSTGTEIVVTTDLTTEASPPSTATIEVCGVRTATGDLDVSVAGSVITLTTTTLDFTTLGLTVGQTIWVGGDAAANQFTTAGNSGFARIVSIAANAMVIDKTDGSWATEANTTKDVDIYFGRFLRNVPVEDADFYEQSFQFEGTYPDLEAVGTDCYEYAKGNYCNEMTINLPLTDKATISFGFVGTDTTPPATSRATEAANAIDPIQTVAFNTSADIGRLRITDTDETGLSTYFKSLNLTFNNNVSPEKVLATLGAVFMNVGNFDVDVEAQLLFTNKEVPAAIRSNTTVTIDFSVRNDDGGIFFDLPAVTLGGGDKEFPENETVLINTPAQAFKDTTLGYSIGVSLFPYLPAA